MDWGRLARNSQIFFRLSSVGVPMMAGNLAAASEMMSLASSGVVMVLTGRGEASGRHKQWSDKFKSLN